MSSNLTTKINNKPQIAKLNTLFVQRNLDTGMQRCTSLDNNNVVNHDNNTTNRTNKIIIIYFFVGFAWAKARQLLHGYISAIDPAFYYKNANVSYYYAYAL